MRYFDDSTYNDLINEKSLFSPSWYGTSLASRNRVITAATIANDSLYLEFDGKDTLCLHDNGRWTPNVHRYLRTDDELRDLIGHRYQTVFMKALNIAHDMSDDNAMNEVCFLDVITDQNTITLSAHNDHTGFYSGFGLALTLYPDTTLSNAVTPPRAEPEGE